MLQKPNTLAVVTHHCLSEDRAGAAPEKVGGGGLPGGGASSFVSGPGAGSAAGASAGSLQDTAQWWQGPDLTDPKELPGLAAAPRPQSCRQRGAQLPVSKWALGPASQPGRSERGSEGGLAGWSRGPLTRSAAAGGRRAGSAPAATVARRRRPGHPAARPAAWEGGGGGSAPRPAARRSPFRPAPSQRASLTGASSPRAA